MKGRWKSFNEMASNSIFLNENIFLISCWWFSLFFYFFKWTNYPTFGQCEPFQVDFCVYSSHDSNTFDSLLAFTYDNMFQTYFAHFLIHANIAISPRSILLVVFIIHSHILGGAYRNCWFFLLFYCLRPSYNIK